MGRYRQIYHEAVVGVQSQCPLWFAVSTGERNT